MKYLIIIISTFLLYSSNIFSQPQVIFESSLTDHSVLKVEHLDMTSLMSHAIEGIAHMGVGVHGTSTNAVGVHGTSTNAVGVFGTSTNDVGVHGTSTTDSGVSGYSKFNSGVLGVSDSGIGAQGESITNIGVFGRSTTGSGVYGSSTDGKGVEGFSENSYGVYGNSANMSDFWAEHGTYNGVSSRRYKNNIVKISGSLDKISKLRGVYFDWDEAHGGKHTIGFIAEEVGEVIPEIVIYEENGIDAKGMDYSKMTPLLVEAANAMRQEYQDKFDKQQSQINILTRQLAELTTMIKDQAANW